MPRIPTWNTILLLLILLTGARSAPAELKTWDGLHSIEKVEVTVVYFLPSDRVALPDWQQRASYFCRRIEQFHQREYTGQSTLTTRLHDKPFRSALSTEQLRVGDGDAIFFKTLREVDSALKIDKKKGNAFPILLVLSDINWRPLDDFYRLRPAGDSLEFEGQLINGRHHPGAASGGARATYLADRGIGWGLVSADGWRVPYCGSDCVIYHEGVGHTVGLPHPKPGNGSVMSLGQYEGWISESWLDREQKLKLGWQPPDKESDRTDLFSVFRALPDPAIPQPDQDVALSLKWPADATVQACRVRLQTDLFGPWIEVAVPKSETPPNSIALGRFDRPTPVSYRVDAETSDGQKVELWGYFQVRSTPNSPPMPPPDAPREVASQQPMPNAEKEVDLLSLVTLPGNQVSGEWQLTDGRLLSPKEYGARMEVPYQPPDEYQLTVIAEPLDEPNGLILAQRSGDRRFVVLLHFDPADPVSALENIDGQNVRQNGTTLRTPLLKRNQLSQIICTVRKNSVEVTVDGRKIIDWTGDRARLSLSDYWQTPNKNALFLGTYDCRYRFYRVTLKPISGEGQQLNAKAEREQ